MGELPLVSVIIANWNREILLALCIQSIYAQNYPNLEVIVVDNQSTDRSIKTIRALYPDVKIIVESVDLGACAAINTGCLSASGRYVMILDNDASFMRAGELEEAVKTLESNPKVDIGGKWYWVGAIAGHIHTPNDTSRETDDDHIHYNWMFCGAGILIRKVFGDLVGWYDPEFFIYSNEMDLGAKLEKIGVAIQHHPDFDIWHAYSDAARPIPRNTYYHTRNNYTVYIRHLPFKLAIKYSIKNAARIIGMPRGCIFPAIRAAMHTLWRLKKTIGERNPIQNPWMITAFDKFSSGLPMEREVWHSHVTSPIETPIDQQTD